MGSTREPSVSHGENSLPLVLIPEAEDEFASLSVSDRDSLPDELPTLTSARYGDPSPIPSPASQHHPDKRSRGSLRRPARKATRDTIEEEEPDVQRNSIPIHPISSLQDAFAESLLEVTGGIAVEKPKLRLLDGPARREALLDQAKDEPPFGAFWRLRPGQKQHELAKLVSQISFGVHLLLDGNANSNAQVVDILQGHIDEVDEFLEVILEDLAQAEQDVAGRIEELSLPMTNMPAFETMLEDRKYRAEILESTQAIDHALARTNTAMRQWEEDIDAGLQASSTFIEWLNSHTDGGWKAAQSSVLDIFDAMHGNAEGWLLAFERMSGRIQELTSLVLKLMNLVADVESKAGEVSRRTWTSVTPFSPPHAHRISGASYPSSSFRSYPKRALTHASFGSGSFTQVRPPSTVMSDLSDELDELDFPMPQGSLRPPPVRVPPPNVDVAVEDDGFRLSPATYSPMSAQRSIPGPSATPLVHEDDDSGEECQATQSPVFILQPRTYTPQPPAPLPSPLVKDPQDHSSRSTRSSVQSHAFSDSRSSTHSSMSMGARLQTGTWQQAGPHVSKRTSLRQRVSLKARPPQDIHIPPRSLQGMEIYAHSSNTSTPRTTPSTAYGSEDSQYRRQHPLASASQKSSMSPGFYSTASSPQIDHRYYHPVMASPHSPLQQRPHTAVGTSPPTSHQHAKLMPPPLLRNRPSQIGGMSVATTKTSRSYDGRLSASASKNQQGDHRLKKKKSAFGWLKKAFSMDEDERAAYEARKANRHQDRYYDTGYDAGGPNRFLDGKRVR